MTNEEETENKDTNIKNAGLTSSHVNCVMGLARKNISVSFLPTASGMTAASAEPTLRISMEREKTTWKGKSSKRSSDLITVQGSLLIKGGNRY